MTHATQRARLLEGPVAMTLIRMTLPMLVGVIGMVAFNLVDTFFVGRLGTRELAAMSFTFPVVLVVSSIARGLGIGTAALLSRAIGEGDRHRVRRLTSDALLLSLLVVSAFVIAGQLTLEPLFRLLGADGPLLAQIKRYMRIWYLGMPFVVVPMVGNNAIRATGDTRTPSLIMLCAIAVNLALDPLLIFGPWVFPRWELAGAALATVIARATTLLISLRVLIHREKMVTLQIPRLKELLVTWKNLLYLGLPAAATYMIIPLSAGVITRLVAGYGPERVAGFGVATRIEMFALTVVMALSMVQIPFIGQNMGARRYGRIRQGLRFGQIFALAWGILLFLVFLFTRRSLSGIFNKNPEVIATTSLYLMLVSVSYSALGLIELNGAAFNALHTPMPAAALSALRMLVLYVPLALLGSHLLGLRGIFAAAAVANIVTAVMSSLWIRHRILRLV